MREASGVTEAVRRRGAWVEGWYWPVAAVSMALLAAVAVWRMESSAADFDPQFMRVVVERTMRAGGGYYENAIHNKGPLEPFVFELARHVGGSDGFWFVIAAFALVAAVCVAAGAAVVATTAGGPRWVALAVGAAVAAHLTLSEADYAGVLYARNIVVAMLAVAFAAATLDHFWATERQRRVTVAVVGLATGLAVQTLLTAAFTAAPVLLYAMWVRRHERVGGRPAWFVLPVVSAGGFVSAIVYYAVAAMLGLRSFGDFVDGWWTYARFMSEATGRGLSGQVDLAWHQATDYYGDRPLVGLTLVVWAVVAVWRARRGSGGERARVVVLAAWFAGAWVELAASQRYSSHYFSVLAVPTVLIASQLVGWATALVRARLDGAPAGVLLVPLAALLTVQAGGTAPFGEGIDKLATVHSAAGFGARRDGGLGGRIHFQRAVMSLFARPGDPLLAWTSYPWTYLDHQRTSATRYIWKDFLLGEIYLGGRSDEYVLPGSWERWEAEVAETAATAYLVETANPVESGTPFERVVAERYQTVYAGEEATLALRTDLADWLLGPPEGAGPVTPAPGGVIAEQGCVRVDGTLGEGTTTFMVGDPGPQPAWVAVTLGPDGGGTGDSQRWGVAGFATAVPVTTGQAPVAFTLVSGARATVLVVGGRVVAAVERGGRVAVEGGLTDGYTVAASHPLSGC